MLDFIWYESYTMDAIVCANMFKSVGCGVFHQLHPTWPILMHHSILVSQTCCGRVSANCMQRWWKARELISFRDSTFAGTLRCIPLKFDAEHDCWQEHSRKQIINLCAQHWWLFTWSLHTIHTCCSLSSSLILVSMFPGVTLLLSVVLPENLMASKLCCLQDLGLPHNQTHAHPWLQSHQHQPDGNDRISE